MLLPGGILPGCFRVTISFTMRGYAPTHLAIPAEQLPGRLKRRASLWPGKRQKAMTGEKRRALKEREGRTTRPISRWATEKVRAITAHSISPLKIKVDRLSILLSSYLNVRNCKPSDAYACLLLKSLYRWI